MRRHLRPLLMRFLSLKTQTGHTIVAFAALTIGVAGLAALIALKPEPEPAAIEERVWPVTTVTLARRSFAPEITVFGEVVAGRAAELRPLVAGPIIDVSESLNDGASVRADETLLRIDPFEYEIALEEAEAAEREAAARLAELLAEIEAERSLVANDEKQVGLRQRDFTRRRDLRRRGAGTQKAADDAELALAQARQALISREQAVRRLEAQIEQQGAALERAEAATRRARRDLADAELTAPFDGVLTGVADIAPGKRVGVGDPVARLIDTARLEARMQIPDADFARLLGANEDASLLIGSVATVSWNIGAESYRYAAKIARIGAEVDPASGGVDVFLEIADAAGGALRPGAFVEASLSDRPLDGVFVAPAESITDDGVLHIVGDDNRLLAIPVQILRRFEGEAAVTGSIPNGARAVARRFPEIGPGLKVSPK